MYGVKMRLCGRNCVMIAIRRPRPLGRTSAARSSPRRRYSRGGSRSAHSGVISELRQGDPHPIGSRANFV